MMDAINQYYVRLLHLGFIVLRQAIDAKDWEWADREREFLHNIPSLINEPNIKRHEHFWNNERPMYVEWVNKRGGDAKSRMLTYYEPTFCEMDTAIQELIAAPISRS
jgi:hypothetical protein